MVNVNIIYPKDSWILQKIGLELLKINDKNIQLSNNQADINYYMDWTYWQSVNNLAKGKFDIVLFTHCSKKNEYRLSILDKADIVVCMSLHGRQWLVEKGINDEKIEVCPYFGVSIGKKKKIVIGTSGRNYPDDRKNWQEVEQLKKDLDNSIFEFKHSNTTDNKFFENIDYYLQASKQEGGSMDILNAIYSRTPVVSRNIGFIYTMQTNGDFIYDDYEELFLYFETIEENIKQKDEAIKNCTWDNFRKWHIDLFRRINE